LLKPEFVDRLEATYSYKNSYRLNVSLENYADVFSTVILFSKWFSRFYRYTEQPFLGRVDDRRMEDWKLKG
jgi:hypothetical protein